MKDIKTETISIRLTEKLRKRIEEVAAQIGVSEADYIRNLVINDLQKKEELKTVLFL